MRGKESGPTVRPVFQHSLGLGGGGGKGGEGSPKRPTDASLILRVRKYSIDLITARKVRLKGKKEAVSVHEVFDDYAAELRGGAFDFHGGRFRGAL
jgi:hypothetical protein